MTKTDMKLQHFTVIMISAYDKLKEDCLFDRANALFQKQVVVGELQKTMMPAEEGNEELPQWRITSWKECKAPEGCAFPGDPRKWEQTEYPAAVLSSAGKKLLGLDKW